MWTPIIQTGVANATMDFTSEFSLLAAGLAGLLWLSAGMITWMAVQHYREQTTLQVPELTPASTEYPKAA
jgi:hypothetical protein